MITKKPEKKAQPPKKETTTARLKGAPEPIIEKDDKADDKKFYDRDGSDGW